MNDFYFQELEAAERSAQEIRQNHGAALRSFSDNDLEEESKLSCTVAWNVSGKEYEEDFGASELYIDLLFFGLI